MVKQDASAPRLAELRRQARLCGAELVRAGRRVASAESCTGGLIAATCTDIPGSSDWFEAGFVTYQLHAKHRILDVSNETLRRCGAVSEATAREMALGALDHCDAHVAVSVTGIAGPGGGDARHPTGTVWFAWALRGSADGGRVVKTAMHLFPGNRDQVRRAAVAIALKGVLNTASSCA